EVVRTERGHMATYANMDFAWGLEDAMKAAAQADYERRVLSSLSVKEPEGAEPGAWTMRINYGPDGEANYANVYSGTGEFVGNLRVHHAGAIVDAFASPPPKAVIVTDEMVERVVNAAFQAA